MKISNNVVGATKLLICILIIPIYIFLALILHLFIFAFPKARQKIISQLNSRLAGILKKILGIKIVIEREDVHKGKKNFYIICNHLTYLDGVILGSIFPVLFVSKKEVRSWPLFGQMASLGSTIFIDRESKDKTLDYVQKISQVLNDGINVLVFPEGTSTDGTKLLPFQAVFFRPPITSRTPILPIAIKYLQIDDKTVSEANKNKVLWYGKMPFFAHLWGVLKLKKIVVEIKIYPEIDSTKFKEDSLGRKELSNVSHNVISKSIGNVQS